MTVRDERAAARRRRLRARQVRRRRIGLLVVLAALAVGVVLATSSGPGPRTATRTSVRHAAPRPAVPPAVEAGLLPWRLPAPLSREAVLAQPGSGTLLIAGGLDASGSSVGGIYALDTHNGTLSSRGTLASATHDAAWASLGRSALVIGGGTAAPAASTQRFIPGGASALGPPLPQARADATAVTVGSTVYVVGGYDGPSMDAEVLATSNGSRYRPVAALPVPVRYPAVAALDGRVYVFGGMTRAGQPLSVVQVVTPGARRAEVIGHLPTPLAGAAAAVLGRSIYLAGGTTGAGAGPVNTVYAFEPAHASFLRAGSLQVAVANAGATVSRGRLWIVGGETAGAQPSGDVQVVTPDRRFGTAGRPGAGSPFYGARLLIADRGNNRLLVLDDTGRIVWRYPSAELPPPPGGFYFPDDAFFIHKGRAIISNQEDNDTIVEIAYPSGRILFQYGHPRSPGAGPGYLNTPDDTYLLRDGDITVADASNCRVLVLDPATRRVVHQIGTAGTCVHSPPATIGSPNGDTPLADGDLLVSEITGSWIDEFTPAGRLVWDAKLAIGYPSDPQQVGPDRYLIADYEEPGAIVEFDRRGRILYRYQPGSGPGMLNHPSLVELLPSGVFMLNDDYNDRMVAVDPATRALVWQYGKTGQPGTAPGLLAIPDGFDLLAAGGTTPTHPATG